MPLLVRKIEKRATPGIVFHIDSPSPAKMYNEDHLAVSGWAVCAAQPISSVIARQGDTELARSALEITRPRVKLLHPDYYNSEAAGFNLAVPPSSHCEDASVTLSLLLQNGEQIPIASILTGYAKKIVYVHIAKTAGTSVNRFLTRHMDASEACLHLESNQDWNKATASFSRKTLLSGHITFSEFSRRLDLRDYYKIITLRNPIDQVLSHIAWIRKLCDEGQQTRYAAHPAYIQDLAIKMTWRDLGDPEQLYDLVSNLTDAEFRLLDNTQTRYLTASTNPAKITEIDLETAKSNLRCFDAIGFSHSLGDFFEKIARDMNWPPRLDIPFENVSTDKYGLDPANPEIIDNLKPLIQFDRQLYEFAIMQRTT